NQTWDLVTSNLSGFDVQTEVSGGGGTTSLLDFMRGPVDDFFFTIIYAVIVYLMGMSCFKLIDTIPASILRWMGQSVSTFNDAREDAGQSLMGAAGVGVQQAVQGIGQGFGGGLQGIAKMNG